MLLNALHIARIWRQRCLMLVLVMSEPLRQFSICHAEPPVQGNATQTSTGQCARALVQQVTHILLSFRARKILLFRDAKHTAVRKLRFGN